MIPSASIPGQKNLIKEVGKEALSQEPPFTIDDIKNAIPAHCFDRDYVTSFKHLGWDLIRIAALFGVAYYVHFHLDLPLWLSIPFWLGYWALQGTIMTGVWVIGHECGHQAFSKYRWLNDTVGLILHSSLLVPYFSWSISHAAHHYYTGNFEKDEVHVPYLREEVEEFLPWDTFRALSSFIKHVTLGWPAYLFTNVSSNRGYKDQHVNHFSPWSPLFSKEDRKFVVISNIALLVFLYILYWFASVFGFMCLLKLYVVPYLIVNFWLVTITKLQHTNPDVPYFENKEWGWLIGQLTTIDRDFGPFLNKTLHYINNTHLTHHLFSKIPFYHAPEATEAVKKVVGHYYRFNDAPVWKQIWNVFSECVYIEKEGRAYWFYRG